MKKIFIKMAAVLLILAGGVISSCGKEKKTETENGNVPYAACLHEEGEYLGIADVKGEAYLFNDSVPNAMQTELQQIRNVSGFVAWIVYIPDDGSAIKYVRSIKENSTGIICNYPEFAKQWKIPFTGKKVYYEGKTFKTGEYTSVPPFVGYDIVLTVLKQI
jgi:hypothetical protein